MIHIITDSSSDYDLTLAAQQQVEIIPMRICFGETEYLDRQTISVADFYTKLEQADTLPSTSQITPFPVSSAVHFNQHRQQNKCYIPIIFFW